ncbi:vitellogenin-A2-like [Onthophagus taurus]|uniref:vitellogenin-A2-like n=1 Tax=Onthophagus taurus TaxID=166361 RepID=UPI000C1FF93B|nr:uncharacterized protein LOC111414756 [Onthophagus taurus]
MSTISDSAMYLVTITPVQKRSVSPMTPSPSREVKGIRLFRAISRKLARRSHDDLCEDDSRSSSTDSCSSTSVSRCSRSRKLENNSSSSAESGFRSVSPHHLSSSSSDNGEIQIKNRHHHSTSAESIRKVFHNLSIGVRSQSCNNTKEKKKSKKNVPKKILRPPVTYTYVKGLSGLPTQRIPKNIPRMYMNNPCGCSMQYMSGLNR